MQSIFVGKVRLCATQKDQGKKESKERGVFGCERAVKADQRQKSKNKMMKRQYKYCTNALSYKRTDGTIVLYK